MEKPDRETIDRMFRAAREAVRKTRADEQQDESCVFCEEPLVDPKQVAAIEKRMQTELEAQNQRIADSDSGKNALQMRTILPEAIHKERLAAAAKAAQEKK